MEKIKNWLSKINMLNSKGIVIPPSSCNAASYAIPPDSGKKAILAKTISEFFIQESESLLWIDEYGIWPSSEDRNLFDGFRKSLGETKHLQDTPGHIFTRQDLTSIASLLSLVLYFCWGAIIVSKDKNILVRISHDEVLTIYMREGEEQLKTIKAKIELIISSSKEGIG